MTNNTNNIELTILMPCLNEENTIGECILEAKEFIQNSSINGEILIADNNSDDRSVEIAKDLGASVIIVNKKGYGSALINGINASRGKYIIMGDCDMSYDFLHLEDYVENLRLGASLVIGNRYKGGIEKGAMPFSHKYIGVPILSWIARNKYHIAIGDFHCGLRGFNRKDAIDADLSCEGMEFATEIIYKLSRNGKKIVEIPTILRKDKRLGKPHLRTIRDGVRHLNFILFNS